MLKKINFIFLLLLFKFSVIYSAAPPAGSYLVVNNPHNSGFFATFLSVLGALSIYEEGGYAGISVVLNNDFYIDVEKGPNWWSIFLNQSI